MSECFVPRIKAIDDIYYRFSADIPVSLPYDLRTQFEWEWKLLEERIEKELEKARLEEHEKSAMYHYEDFIKFKMEEAREQGRREALERHSLQVEAIQKIKDGCFDNGFSTAVKRGEKLILEAEERGFLRALEEIEIYFETHRAMDKYDFLCLKREG